MTRGLIVAFLWQKSLHKRATVLGFTCIFYLVGNNVIIDTSFLTFCPIWLSIYWRVFEFSKFKSRYDYVLHWKWRYVHIFCIYGLICHSWMFEFKTFGSFNFTKLKANSFNTFKFEIFLNSVLKFTASPLQISTVNFCGEIIPENRRKKHINTRCEESAVFSHC